MRLKHRLIRPRDERGSIAVAVMIIMILATLSGALLTEVVAVSKSVVNTQSHDTAIVAAEAGVSDALFRMDELGDVSSLSSLCGGRSGPGSVCFCVGTDTAICPAADALSNVSLQNLPNVSYRVDIGSGNVLTIHSADRTSTKATGAVVARATPVPAFHYAMFGNRGLTFNGNASNGFTTYNDTSSYNSGSNPNPSGSVSIGSNGTITCTSTAGLGTNVSDTYYAGGGGVNSSCVTAGGPAPTAMPTKYAAPTPSTPSGAYQACPNNGLLGSANSYPTIAPGTYVCNVPIKISGSFAPTAGASASNPVKLYVLLAGTSYQTSSTTAVTITHGSTVNAQLSYSAGQALPQAADFQLYSDSIGAVGGDNGTGYAFGGIIDAPNAFLTSDGCQSTYYGALVINDLTCNGGPNLNVNYDSALSTYYGSWTVSQEAEIPEACTQRSVSC